MHAHRRSSPMAIRAIKCRRRPSRFKLWGNNMSHMFMQKRTRGPTRQALPEWYPLPVYSANLTSEQWFEALMMRFLAWATCRDIKDAEYRQGCFAQLIQPDFQGELSTRLLRVSKWDVAG